MGGYFDWSFVFSFDKTPVNYVSLLGTILIMQDYFEITLRISTFGNFGGIRTVIYVTIALGEMGRSRFVYGRLARPRFGGV